MVPLIRRLGRDLMRPRYGDVFTDSGIPKAAHDGSLCSPVRLIECGTSIRCVVRG